MLLSRTSPQTGTLRLLKTVFPKILENDTRSTDINCQFKAHQCEVIFPMYVINLHESKD